MTRFPRLLSLAAGALVLLALVPSGQAQDLRIGYVDTDQIVVRMPAFADVQGQLQQQQQAVGQRVRFVQDSLRQVLQTRVEEYQTFDQSAVATDEARRTRQQEILQLQGGIEQAEVEGLQYLSYVEARLLQPVLTEIDNAIRAEAEANGYDLVLPTVANNAPVFLYSSDRVPDLTDVNRRLEIQFAAIDLSEYAEEHCELHRRSGVEVVVSVVRPLDRRLGVVERDAEILERVIPSNLQNAAIQRHLGRSDRVVPRRDRDLLCDLCFRHHLFARNLK